MLFCNYFTNVTYTPSFERGELKPTSFILQPLPYRYLSDLTIIYQNTSSSDVPDVKLTVDVEDLLLSLSVVNVTNLIGYNHRMNLRDILPLEYLKELVQVISTYFVVGPDDRKEIETLAELSVNDRFSDESWNCSVCQKRGLDKQRNCPYLIKEDKEKYFNPSLFYPMNGEKVFECPMGTYDTAKMNALVEAGMLFRKGLMPEVGGFGDQTMFFGVAGQAVSRKIDEKRAKELNKNKD